MHSLVTRIALNLGCEEMANVSYIAGDVTILGLSHFMHAHILREEPDRSISMLYEVGSKVLRLPNPTVALESCEQLTLQLNRMGDAHHSYIGQKDTHRRAHLEVTRQTPPQPQWDTGYVSSTPEYQGVGTAFHPHDIPGPSHGVGTSATLELPHWYYPLERFVSYGVDKAQPAVEGIGPVERRFDEREHVQTEKHASINS
jgi:hypothetical protein